MIVSLRTRVIARECWRESSREKEERDREWMGVCECVFGERERKRRREKAREREMFNNEKGRFCLLSSYDATKEKSPNEKKGQDDIVDDDDDADADDGDIDCEHFRAYGKARDVSTRARSQFRAKTMLTSLTGSDQPYFSLQKNEKKATKKVEQKRVENVCCSSVFILAVSKEECRRRRRRR